MYTPSASGGHARYTHSLLSALSEVGRDKGVLVSLVTSSDLAPQYRTSLYPIHDILPPLVPRPAFRSVLQWALSRLTYYVKRERTFLRWIRERRPCEGIHFQEYTLFLVPRHFRWLRARGIRLFFTVHQFDPYQWIDHLPWIREINLPGRLDVMNYLVRYYLRTTYRLSDALFVHSEGLREQLAEFLGEGHPPIFVTPHGVSDPFAEVHTVANPRERVQRRRLIFFGRIERYKGVEILLRAMEGLPDCTLTIAGEPVEPRYHKEIISLVRQLPPGQVELIDRFIEDDEVALLFEQCSLAILPYTSFSGQSAVLHDALAYELPVVATEVGALGENVRRWGIGKVVPPNDTVALAGAIREMLTLDRYSEASRAIDRIRREISWNRSAETTIEAYRSVGLGKSKATAR